MHARTFQTTNHSLTIKTRFRSSQPETGNRLAGCTPKTALSGLVCCALLAAVLGCNQSSAKSEPGAGGAKEFPSPANVVAEFMDALKTGNAATASNLLTPTARQKTEEAKLEVGYPASKSATFEVGEVEMIDDDGAHVASTWTDRHDEGEERTDRIVWILRKEKVGWRVAGMAMKIFDDAPPLILNFEDPADMLRKQQLAEQELKRRFEQEESQASLEKRDLK